MVGLIGPGWRRQVEPAVADRRRAQDPGRHGRVLAATCANAATATPVCPRIAYMPQGLGKTSTPPLSVEENLQFFARLFGHDAPERRRRIDDSPAPPAHPF